ncbi:hypothetical protein AVEN_186609-1, partial [Araneus ventricosus]
LTKTRPDIYGPIEHLVLWNHLSTREGGSCEKGYRLACGISPQNYDLLSNYEVIFKMPNICNMRWLAKESISRNQLPFRRCESQKKGCRLICRIWHPTPVQNYEVLSKILSICNVRWPSKESISRNQLTFRRCESQEMGCRLICRI